MTKPTKKQLEAEIAALTAIKTSKTFRRTTFFGESNLAGIDAQIDVLEGTLSGGKIDDSRDSGELKDYEADLAQDAVDWMDGTIKNPPSKGWKGLY